MTNNTNINHKNWYTCSIDNISFTSPDKQQCNAVAR